MYDRVVLPKMMGRRKKTDVLLIFIDSEEVINFPQLNDFMLHCSYLLLYPTLVVCSNGCFCHNQVSFPKPSTHAVSCCCFFLSSFHGSLFS